MDYSEFLNKFYLPNQGGGIAGYKAKKKIPLFFIENGLVEDYDDNIINPSDSTYEKWMSGSRKPDSSVWAEIIRSFDDSKLQKALISSLNPNVLTHILENFEISLEIGESPDIMMLSKAIVAQYKKIASGNGIADNIVPQEYKKPPELKGFSTYLREAKNKYKWMKMPGEEECLLSEYFVCNNIGTSSAAFPHRIRGNYIEEATLPKIRRFDRRGEIRHTILIGSCGYGKTLMIQHLFLDAVEHMAETGLLPIIADLKNFSSRYDDMVTFLADAVQEFDQKFTEEMIKDLLEMGQVEVMFDGLDEMNPEETQVFQRRLAELCHRYSGNQIVISSRQCAALKGIRGFVTLYIQPLNEEQSQELIEKLLVGINNPDAKEVVFSFMDTNRGFIRRNGFIATNPMLLTIIVRHHKEINSFSCDKERFYKLMFDALTKDHDEEKESFQRFFHSVANRNEFTQAFREFCALAYMDGVYIFDDRSFEKYFKQLQCKSLFINPSIFELSKFQHDVCATACMMYEQESGIYYIDQGFQDYFFADYYYYEDTERTKTMGKALWRRKVDSFRNLDALKMLYKIAEEKFNTCIFLPFLDFIFSGKKDNEAFLRYLYYTYGNVVYTLLDEPKINLYLTMKTGSGYFDIIPDHTIAKNIVMDMLFDILALPNTFKIGSFDQMIGRDENTTHFISGYYDIIENDDQEKSKTVWIRAVKHGISNIDDENYFHEIESTHTPITDENNNVICFGYIYKVDPLSLLDKPEQQKMFIDLFNIDVIRKPYEKIKQYYLTIREEQKAFDYR